MNGLDKIIAQILDDADSEAKEILTAAEKESEEIRKAASESVKKLEAENAEKLSQKEKLYMERIASSADLKKRQAILLAKQQVIAGMLEKAHEALLEKEDAEYFALIEKMLGRFALDKTGAIYFSKRDLDRLPKGFEAVIEKAAEKKGGSLVLVKEPKNIDGGFVLVYGGVEENCSFKAIFSARKDELSDKVHEMLFS